MKRLCEKLIKTTVERSDCNFQIHEQMLLQNLCVFVWGGGGGGGGGGGAGER